MSKHGRSFMEIDFNSLYVSQQRNKQLLKEIRITIKEIERTFNASPSIMITYQITIYIVLVERDIRIGKYHQRTQTKNLT